jgi:hypothetical protein
MDAQGLADAFNRVRDKLPSDYPVVVDLSDYLDSKCDFDVFWWGRQKGSWEMADALGLRFRFDESAQGFAWVCRPD